MPVGEAFLGAFLQVLFDRLAPRKLSLFPSQDGIRSELKHWKKKLLIIQTVINDAEEKQLTNPAVRMWLDDLRDLAYDVEDILDEYATQALERQLMPPEQPTNKITDYFSSFTPTALMSNLNIKSKIEEITARLEDLCEERDDLGLEKIAGSSGTSSTAVSVWQRPPSTCVPTEPAVFGRNDDKARILEMLLKNEPSDVNFRVIPIVGIGGIGKTTLAREVYNDNAVKDYFNLMAWVCVSEDFDVFRISKAILESITSESCNLNNLNQVHVELRDKVARKKFMLVLDDVWSNDYGLWEILRSPFMAGAPGSRILVTTRLADVALTMGQHGEYYRLELLSDDACWDIFEKHTFENRGTDAHRTSQFVRDKVIEKCRGLPLAARTLGGLLRCKQSIGEWEVILNSKIWNLSDNNEIPVVLKLSYYHLPSHLKRCFAYCAIFPKDYEFMEKDLVLLWMAEGLIQPSRDNKEPEDVGGEYFRDLFSRSIFQRSNSDGSKYVMHDLVNDLAQWASGDTCFRLEDGMRINNQSKRFKKVRYSSYTCAAYNGEKKFEVFHGFGNLRTFLQVLLIDDILTFHYITDKVMLELLPKFERLRVLSLRKYNIKKLSDSIGNLRHLRYLNLSDTHIKSLPKPMNSLFNLQVLILRNCCIKKLPPMGNLINLRHLDIDGVNLKEMPNGMRNWENLQTLSNFIVSSDKNFGLENLKDLKFLRGKLCIFGLENVIDLQEAILSDKEKLDDLLLSWRAYSDERLPSGEKEKLVLDMLRPHKILGKLTIEGYGGTRFSNWVGDSTYSNTTVLKLERCTKIISLPSLGMLVSLKNLTISWMMGLKRIGCEIYGNNSSKSFQSLETLHFESLHEWEHWDPISENDYVERFPRLKELSIIDCPKLCGRLPNHLPLLKKLQIHGCPQFAVSIYHFPSLEKLVIRECAQLDVSFSTLCKLEVEGCREMICRIPTDCNSLTSMKLSNISRFENWLGQGFKRVEYLEIVGCEQLVSLWRNEICPEKLPQGLHSLTSLRELFIGDCSSLVLLPEADFLCTLTKLKIRNCDYLTSLPDRIKLSNAHLECLEIEGCHSLGSIVRGQIPSSLRLVSVRNCGQLQCLLDDREDVDPSLSPFSFSLMPKEEIHNTVTSCLEFLSISDCPSLRCLSSKGQLPATIKHLDINNCSKLTTLSSMGQLPADLKNLKITNCSQLTTLSMEGQLPASVKSLEISNCSQLTTLSLEGQLPGALKSLKIAYCSKLTTLSLEGQLPETLEDLFIVKSLKLESIGKSFHSNMSLVAIQISSCVNLTFIPDALHNLSSLHKIYICDCPNLVSFPELPNTIQELSVVRCENLKALPSFFHGLNSLKKLSIHKCSSIVTFPEEGFPTNLTSLEIVHLNIFKPLMQWGLHKLTSLSFLWIEGCPDLVSFPQEEVGMKLPSTLTQLRIGGFPKLKYLSSNGFKNLTFLQYLEIDDCPNLVSLPSRDLLSSVVHFGISLCPLLEERLTRNGGELSKIAHIPYIHICPECRIKLESQM